MAAAAAAFAVAAPMAMGADPSPVLPLKVSASGRHLVDQKDRPFLYCADTAWMLFLKLTRPEAAEYLSARQAQGFNTVQVQLTGFLGQSNRDGHLPFAGTPPEQDLSRPVEAYFAHAESVIDEARRLGLLLAIAPAWSGCCGEGWAGTDKEGRPKPLNQNGPDRCQAWGEWLGRRFGKFPNVIWILGGDNDPHNARNEIRALATGLKSAAPHQLVTYHAASTHSSTDVWPADEPWLDLSMVYTYFRGFNKAWNKNQPDVHEVSHAEFAKSPVRPFFLGESTYEGEHGDWGSPLQVRKQAAWCLLGGGCGHAYGSLNWNFPDAWRDHLKLPGASSLRHLRDTLERRQWWLLVPDTAHALLADGHTRTAPNDAAVAAVASDQSFAVAYLPSARPLRLHLQQLRPAGGPLALSWIEAATGKIHPPARHSADSTLNISPPGPGDWILAIDPAP